MTNTEEITRDVIRELLKIVEAQERLLVAYRVGGRTPEKALDILQDQRSIVYRARTILEEIH